MKRRSLPAVGAVCLCLLFMIACSSEVSYEDMTHEQLTYKEAPIYLQERIDEIQQSIDEENRSGSTTIQMDGGDGKYAVIFPPEDKTVDVLYVGKDDTMGYGIMVKYTFTDSAGMDSLERVTVVKINQYQGFIRLVYVSG